MKKKIRIFSLSIAIMFLFIKCNNKIFIPASDNTPPIVTWEVLDKKTNVTTRFSTDNSEFDLLGSDSYIIKLYAVDPQGVKYITMQTQESPCTCVTKLDANKAFETLQNPELLSLPNSNQNVNLQISATQAQTNGFIFYTFPTEILCGRFTASNNEFYASTGQFIFIGTGENYFNLKTVSHLKIRFRLFP